MALIPIPETWRKTVCAILEECTGSAIQWTYDAAVRFEADGDAAKRQSGSTDPVWHYEVYDAFCAYLSQDSACGCSVPMPATSGECYEFLFPIYGVHFYGKILLRTDRKGVVIFSAHRPLKNKLSCE